MPLIAAPDSEAWIRVSLSSSALTILPLRTNGSKTHNAINAKTPPTLSRLRFVFVFFISFNLPNPLISFLSFYVKSRFNMPFQCYSADKFGEKTKVLNNFS